MAKHRKIFFTSDWHLGHANIIGYCGRPFSAPGELDNYGRFYDKDIAQLRVFDMNQRIIKNYNHLVRDEDVVFFLGDLGFKSLPECRKYIRSLNGIKILIMGNHDRWGITSYYNMGFTAVLEEATIRLGQETITLAHHPRRSLSEFVRLCILYMRKMIRKKRNFKQKIQRIKREWKTYHSPAKHWHLCGHVHEKWKVKGQNINIGVDQWDFKPVSAHEVLRIIQKRKK